MFVIIAIILRLLAGAEYIRAVINGKAKPQVISWFFWAVTALIAFFIQISQGVGASAFITLFLALGPIIVVILAFAKGLHRVEFSRVDKLCVALTILGIGLWITTKDPYTALWMSVIADFVSSVPNIVKCYKRPHTEHALAYGLSMASMIVALAGLPAWNIATALYPGYILFINTIFFTLVFTKLSVRVRRWQRLLRKRLQPTTNPAVSVED